MAQSNLTTAKFFQPPDDDPSPDISHLRSSNRRPPTGGERILRWFSLTVAALLVGCLAAVAIPYVATAKSHAPKNPIDWWLRLGGAEEDQTFQKFVKNVATQKPIDFDAEYRKSPVYQLNIQQLDWQNMQGAAINISGGQSSGRRK